MPEVALAAARILGAEEGLDALSCRNGRALLVQLGRDYVTATCKTLAHVSFDKDLQVLDLARVEPHAVLGAFVDFDRAIGLISPADHRAAAHRTLDTFLLRALPIGIAFRV